MVTDETGGANAGVWSIPDDGLREFRERIQVQLVATPTSMCRAHVGEEQSEVEIRFSVAANWVDVMWFVERLRFWRILKGGHPASPAPTLFITTS